MPKHLNKSNPFVYYYNPGAFQTNNDNFSLHARYEQQQHQKKNEQTETKATIDRNLRIYQCGPALGLSKPDRTAWPKKTYKNSRAISRNGEIRSWEPNRMPAADSWSFCMAIFFIGIPYFCLIILWYSKIAGRLLKPSESVLSTPKEL